MTEKFGLEIRPSGVLSYDPCDNTAALLPALRGGGRRCCIQPSNGSGSVPRIEGEETLEFFGDLLRFSFALHVVHNHPAHGNSLSRLWVTNLNRGTQPDELDVEVWRIRVVLTASLCM